MSIDLIQDRLNRYQCQSALEEENALKEITQEIALMALSRSDFFRDAAFQGGTCLRILYGLNRYSEDLDFILNKKDKHFTWEKFIKDMSEEFKAFGYTLEVQDRSKVEDTVKKAFLKEDSIGGVVILNHWRHMPFNIKALDLPSSFAGKCHALLCRDYVKGRDWYDFIWYVSREVAVNYIFLKHAIDQLGPWKNKKINVDKKWLTAELTKKINTINWEEVKADIARFLKPNDLPSLKLWTKDFFLSRVEKMSR